MKTSSWVFITRTRLIELINAISLLGVVLAFLDSKFRVANLPMIYNASELNTHYICWIAGLLALIQFGAAFALDSVLTRRITIAVLMFSSVLWLWLSTLTYYSADWLTSIGIHKQALYAHIILAAACWLTADYIRDSIYK